MVGEAAQHNGWEERAAQRVSGFEVVLTAAYLADPSPSRSWIVAERIVHPFADLMAHRGNIFGAGETVGAVEIAYAIGLNVAARQKCVVVTENATVVGGPKHKRICQHHVVQKKERKCSSSTAVRSGKRNQSVLNKAVPSREVYDRNVAAVERRVLALIVRNIESLLRESCYRVQRHVIAVSGD